jgi:hypothetical protein
VREIFEVTDPKPKSFEHWASVEIMGHQSVVGRCTEEQIAGATLLRVDVPDGASRRKGLCGFVPL